MAGYSNASREKVVVCRAAGGDSKDLSASAAVGKDSVPSFESLFSREVWEIGDTHAFLLQRSISAALEDRSGTNWKSSKECPFLFFHHTTPESTGAEPISLLFR